MTIQKKIGIVVFSIAIFIIVEMIVQCLIYGSELVFIVIPSTAKTWKYFWEK